MREICTASGFKIETPYGVYDHPHSALGWHLETDRRLTFPPDHLNEKSAGTTGRVECPRPSPIVHPSLVDRKFDQPIRCVELSERLSQEFGHEVLVEVAQDIAGMIQLIRAVERQLREHVPDSWADRGTVALVGRRIEVPAKYRLFNKTVNAGGFEKSSILNIGSKPPQKF